jgi:hypothetical protein
LVTTAFIDAVPFTAKLNVGVGAKAIVIGNPPIAIVTLDVREWSAVDVA